MEKSDNNSMQDNKYIAISEGYDLHFWGDLALLVLLKDRYHFRFTRVQTDILEKCTGLWTYAEVVAMVVGQYRGNAEQRVAAVASVKTFLNTLLRKGYLSLYDTPYNISVGKYGRFSGERGKYYPFDVVIELTDRCNYKCPFCYKNSDYCGNDIDFDYLQWIKDNFSGKIKEIRLMGGEPSIYPRFADAVSIFSKDFLVSIVTNGSVLHRFPAEIVRKIDNIQFSLYGYSIESYVKNTGKNGWNDIFKSIQLANEAGVETRASLTLSKDVRQNFEQYILAAIHLGLKRLSFGIPAPAGRAQKTYSTEDGSQFTAEDKKNIYKLMRKMKVKYADKIDLTVWQFGSLHREEKDEESLNCGICLECGAGWYHLVISEKGRVRPCELLDSSIFDYGDLNSLLKIKEGHFFEKELVHAVTIFEKSITEDGVSLSDICSALDRFKHRNMEKTIL